MPKGQISEKNTTMSFVIPKTLKEQLGKIASKENRSMSNLICTLVANYVELYKDKDTIQANYKILSNIINNNKSDTK